MVLRGASVVAALWSAVAATPSPTTDLSEILAPPPSADYIDVSDGSGPTLSGAFDSYRYAEWLGSSPSAVSDNKAAFDANGFTRGYARSWWWPSKSPPQIGYGRRNYLVETVEEYTSTLGAGWRFNGVRTELRQGGEGFLHEVATSLPNSFAVVANQGALFLVIFTKGNDVYIVRMESNLGDDLTNDVLKQAEDQFGMAPAGTTPSRPSPNAAPVAAVRNTNNLLDLGLAAMVVLIGAVTLVALVLYVAGRAGRTTRT